MWPRLALCQGGPPVTPPTAALNARTCCSAHRSFAPPPQCTAKTEVWEFFQRRADKLKERREYVTEEPGGKKGEKVVEHFAEGSSSALKTHISIRGKYRETHYWTEARQDGLVKRVEEFIESEYTYLKWVVSQAFLPRRKTTEWFRGRDDRLEYRSVRYKDMSPEDMVSRQAGEAERTAAQDYMRTETHQGIIKITQKFSRDESVPAGQDVAKRRFCLDPKNDRIEAREGLWDGSIPLASMLLLLAAVSHWLHRTPWDEAGVMGLQEQRAVIARV